MAVPLPHLFIYLSPIGCRSLLSCYLLSFAAISDFYYYSQSNVVCHFKFPTKPLETPINFTLCSSLKCKSINEGEQLQKRVCYNLQRFPFQCSLPYFSLTLIIYFSFSKLQLQHFLFPFFTALSLCHRLFI
jgi:hypothetical protein